MEQRWNAKETQLIYQLADPLRTKTKEQLAEEIGYHPKYIYELQRKPGFKEAICAETRKHVSSALPKIYGALMKLAIKDENVRACELLLKAAGEIQSGTHVVTNVNQRQNSKEFVETLKEAQEYRQQMLLRARKQRKLLEDLDNN